MTTGVLCAVRGGTETLVVRAVGTTSRVEVTRRCADLAELLAAAAAGLGSVSVVSPDLPGLDREAVRHLHGSSAWVVGLADPGAGWPAARVEQLGVDAVVEAPTTEDRLVEALTRVLAAAAAGDVPGRSSGADTVDPLAARPLGARSDEPARGPTARPESSGAGETSRRPPGRLVAVWGPTGAPGRTTVALTLAAELVDRPGGALLVDADTYGGTVAQMLGLLDEAPGIAAAARAAATGRLDVRALAALTPVIAGGLRVLTGISRADRWPELPSSSLEPVWQAARSLAGWTVVDCGLSLEQDEALSYDTRAPRRNAATLSALAAADAVVVVGSGDPIGLQRLVRGLDELTDAGVPASVRHVVVNRVRASASGPRPADAIAGALRRYAGVTDAHLVPDDRAACDGAVLAAQTLREHAPGSPVRRALGILAGALAAERAAVGAH